MLTINSSRINFQAGSPAQTPVLRAMHEIQERAAGNTQRKAAFYRDQAIMRFPEGDTLQEAVLDVKRLGGRKYHISLSISGKDEGASIFASKEVKGPPNVRRMLNAKFAETVEKALQGARAKFLTLIENSKKVSNY